MTTRTVLFRLLMAAIVLAVTVFAPVASSAKAPDGKHPLTAVATALAVGQSANPGLADHDCIGGTSTCCHAPASGCCMGAMLPVPPLMASVETSVLRVGTIDAMIDGVGPKSPRRPPRPFG